MARSVSSACPVGHPSGSIAHYCMCVKGGTVSAEQTNKPSGSVLLDTAVA